MRCRASPIPSVKPSRRATSGGTPICSPAIPTGTSSWPSHLRNCPTKSSNSSTVPVEELCHMLDDWKINWEWHDLPPEVWDFLKTRKFFAMIIPKVVWRDGLFRLRAFGSHSQTLDALDLLRLHGDGAELARPGRIAAAIRHQGAAGLLAAAAGARRGNPVLRPDQPGSRIGRRFDDRFRRGVPRHLQRPRGSRHPAELAQALHHARPDRDRARAGVQAARSRSSDRPARRYRHHASAGADAFARHQHRAASSAGDARVPERPELGPRRFHSDGQCHRRRRPGRQRLENADERARGRTRHFAAVAVGGGRRLLAPISPALTRASANNSTSRFRNSRRCRNGSAGSLRPPICSTPRAA